MSTDGQSTKQRRKIAENLNRLSRYHERYKQTDDRQRQTTNGTAIAYSEREREFTFAKNYNPWAIVWRCVILCLAVLVQCKL